MSFSNKYIKKFNSIISDITVFSKYAKHNKLLKRRETWEEISFRNMNMHIKKYPELSEEITKVYKDFVIPKKVLMSMRSAQFAGKPIELSPNRMYNCCFAPIDDYRVFGEIMFLLLGGTGVGYSVQNNHIEKLPEITKPTKTRKYVINDSIEGWADAVKILCKSYFKGTSKPRFVYDDIRPKGAKLVTSGGKAPGPEPLKDCLHNLEKIFERKENGEQLSSLECHDIVCYIADAVLAGGIRRAALISLFDMDDEDMLTCKFANWWELNPQRGRANNSAVILRHKITKDKFLETWDKIKASGSGEPGIYLSNDASWGSNPCLTGDMLLKTEKGFIPFKDLNSVTNEKNELDFKLYNVNGDLVPGKVWSNGIKDVVQIKISGKGIIKSTPDHRFMLNNGEECFAKDLAGKRLMPDFNINSKINEYTKLGFIQGNASLTRLNSLTPKGMEIHISEKDLDIADLFKIKKEKGKHLYYINGYNEICKDLRFSTKTLPERIFPKTYNMWNFEQKQGFLKGLYSANGCVIKAGRVCFKSTCLPLIEELQETLNNDFNISTYVTTNKPKNVKFNNSLYLCKQSYDLNIGKFEDILIFAKKIAFVHNYKNEDLCKIIKQKSPLITSVKEIGQEEVFDFNLNDETHWGIISHNKNFPGFIAHNCVEIALRPYQFCNLTEINLGNVVDQKDFEARCKAASFLGTLQAGYTDFHYLRDVWKKTTEKDALIGVSCTGIASGVYKKLNLTKSAEVIIQENKRVACLIGINSAARTTCVKPAGTTSLVLGTSSGIHAWFAPYYIRRIRLGKNEAIYKYLLDRMPELIEDEFFNPTKQAVFSMPIEAPKNGIFRDESALNILERIKFFSTKWVKPGHIKGQNSHNVSATISIKDNEWKDVGEWMWNNRDCYNGLSVLPYDGGTYKQAPFEEITKEEFDKLKQFVKDIDLTKVKEEVDETDLKGEIACGAGGCEIN